jgi:uracil-DNA glycosylase family 4
VVRSDLNRRESFGLLVDEARACQVCPRMVGRTRLLGPANGSLRARICFVAEAPGRLGGDRTAIPLCGDQSGRNFERLLAEAGLDRSAIFVTNAVLCNPRIGNRNAPPSTREIQNCSRFLIATLQLVQPAAVVALGAVALKALGRVERHELSLANDVSHAVRWHDRWLIPLYHPGPRAQLWRGFPQQAEDFRRLGAFLRQHGLAPSSVPPGSENARAASPAT